MSFSVHARSFFPSSSPAPFTDISCGNETDAGSTAVRDCVCVAFYESGRCPFGSECEHAHHFSELSAQTQKVLLGSVPVEAIPAHFFGASLAVDRAGVVDAEAAAVPHTCTRYAKIQIGHHHDPESAVSVRRLPSSKDSKQVMSLIRPLAPTPDAASLSSRTSSNAESLHLSGMRFTKTHPPPAACGALTGVAADAAAPAFKMHLPLRCRYPHHSIPGSYYDVLALTRAASSEEIISKYRAWQKDGFKRMRQVDPVGAEAVDRLIVEARSILGNPTLRAAYDLQLPAAPAKQLPWNTASWELHTANTSITSTSRTQGQSSTTSSNSESQHQLSDPSNRRRHSGSDSSTLHTNRQAPTVTIFSLGNCKSIW